MTEKIVVEVVAKDLASAAIKGVAGSFQRISEQITGLVGGRLFERLGQQAMQFAKESVAEASAYATEVKKLSEVTGQTAEETSRLIQVVDDYNVTSGMLMQATRMLTKQGLTPNVETLAKLSDQYLALNPGQERAAFLMEKFGRAGFQMTGLMQKGGAAILEMNGAIDKNLILTKENIDASEEYRLALDELSDTWQGLKVRVGTEAIPYLTDAMRVLNFSIADLRDNGLDAVSVINGFFNPLTLFNDNIATGVIEMIKLNKQLKDGTITQEEYAAALGETSDAMEEETLPDYQRLLGVITNLQTGLDQLKQKQGDLKDKMADMRTEIQGAYEDVEKLRSQGFDENSEELMDAKAKVEELRSAYGNLQTQYNTTAIEHEKATKKIIFDLMVQKLAVGGLEAAEFEMAVQIGTSLGIFDAATAQMAEDINTFTDDVLAGKKSVDDYATAIRGVPKNVTTTLTLNIKSGVPVAGKIAQQAGRTYTLGTGAAMGADVRAGQPIRVGERGEEIFVPPSNGTILTHGETMEAGRYESRGASPVNITVVYSPTVSTASEDEVVKTFVPIVTSALRRIRGYA